jgi:hypothetical protein
MDGFLDDLYDFIHTLSSIVTKTTSGREREREGEDEELAVVQAGCRSLIARVPTTLSLSLSPALCSRLELDVVRASERVIALLAGEGESGGGGWGEREEEGAVGAIDVLRVHLLYLREEPVPPRPTTPPPSSTTPPPLSPPPPVLLSLLLLVPLPLSPCTQ